MRLFAALRPSDDAVEHLVSALRPIQASAPGLRWPDPDQWHLTCAFYGEVPDGSVDSIAARVQTAARSSAPLELSLRGAGSFAGRTLWIGVGGDTDRLRQLMSACSDEDGAQHRRAHLTVARASSRADPRLRGRGGPGRRVPTGGDVDAVVRALAVYAGPAWTSHEVQVVRSDLGRGRSGGALHTVLASFALGSDPTT
jgi:2'-5' RNA ligase